MKNIKSFIKGFNIDPVGSTSIDAEGDVEVYSNGLRVYLQAAPRVITTNDQTQTLTNKTLTGNTAVNLISGSGTFVLNTTGTITAPNGTDTLVALDLTQTLTNKTMSGNDNTFSDIDYSSLVLTDSIVNADINSLAGIEYSKLDLVDSIVDADINSAAAIAYSKLDLVDSIVDADINSLAAIAYSKLDLVDSIIDADINSLAAIAYSKLDLVDSIENADINSAAAIDFSKLASLTSGNILVGSAGNVATSVAMSGEASIANTGAITLGTTAVTGKVLTGFTAGAGTVAATDTILQAFQKLAGSVAGGDVTLTAVGATPNANGASLSGQALTLQPADATNPGVLTAGPQNLGGIKNFNDGLGILGPLLMYQEDDNTTTGSAATVGDTNNPVVVLQDSGLVSITGIENTSGDAKFIVLTNSVGSSVTVINDSGTASERIITGTGANLTLAANASIILYYNGGDSKWYVVGGSGATGANTTLSNLTSPTSINQDLRPSASFSRSLGSGSLIWLTTYTRDLALYSNASGFEAQMTADGVSLPSGASADVGIANFSSNSWGQHTANNATANSTATGAVYIETGNKTAGTGNSGDISIQTGTSAGGTRGTVTIAPELRLNGSTSGYVGIKSPAAPTSYTITLPVNDGSPGEVLSTDGSGVTSWVPVAASGANTALSNLASVAINTTLVSDTDNTDDLGSGAIRWKDLYAVAAKDSSSSNAVVFGSRQLTSGATVKLDWSGTDVSLNTRKLTSVSDPTSAQDAATKNYVDSLVMQFTQLVNTSTGTLGSVPNQDYSVIKFTGAAPVVAGLSSPVSGSRFVKLFNVTGSAITIQNESGSASAGNRIITSTGSTVSLPNNCDVDIVYDDIAARWRLGAISYGINIVSKTANYTAVAGTDEVILCDATSASFTITLPAASGNSGVSFAVKKTDSSVNTVTIDGNASETIDGSLTQVIATQYQAIRIVSTGSAWAII